MEKMVFCLHDIIQDVVKHVVFMWIMYDTTTVSIECDTLQYIAGLCYLHYFLEFYTLQKFAWLNMERHVSPGFCLKKQNMQSCKISDKMKMYEPKDLKKSHSAAPHEDLSWLFLVENGIIGIAEICWLFSLRFLLYFLWSWHLEQHTSAPSWIILCKQRNIFSINTDSCREDNTPESKLLIVLTLLRSYPHIMASKQTLLMKLTRWLKKFSIY